MADIEPPPPALAPISTPDNTPVTAKLGLDDAPPVASPADSEKTVIARAPPCPRPMAAQPGTRAAVFSTDGGRLPCRSPPIPPPPVIVRSDKVRGVIDFANYWREKCPDFYPCFFPNCGWSITDLWDDADIHLESPGFLEEVLRFILNDNHVGATKFGLTWCQQNHDKMDKLGGDISYLFNPKDQLAIVDEFFTEGEQEECPPQFLFYALWILRDTMRSYMSNYHPAQTGGPAGPLSKIEPLPPTVDEYSVTTELKQQQQPTSARPQSAFADQPFSVPGLISSAPIGPLGRQPSFTHPRRSALLQGDGIPMGHHAAMMPEHIVAHARHTKRPGRSGSNSFTQTPHMHGWPENVRMPSGEHMRHPSGPLPNSTVHRFGPSFPMGPGMINPMHPGIQFPPNATMISPPMHPSQIQYMPMMPQNAMFSPSGPLPPQPYQQYGPNPPRPRGKPFVDMANNIQYPPIRGADGRGMQQRNGQHTKSSGLFNPYGAERPDKAGFATTGLRKGGRGNFSNNMGRSRKHSAGMFDRSGHGPHPSDFPDNVAKPSNGHYNECSQPRTASYIFEADPNITSDMEFGCDYQFIGSKNNTVRQLYVRNLPDDIKGPEIQTIIHNCTGVAPTGAEIKFSNDRKEFVHAFILFNSTDDARKVLQVKTLMINGKEVQISVARRYFQAGAPSQHHSRATFQELHRSADTNGTKLVHYSPQDARSDLHHVNKEQQSDHFATHGSPEVRKAKKNLHAKKTHAGRNDQQIENSKVEGFPTTPATTFSVDGNINKRETSSNVENVSTSEPVRIMERSEMKSGNVAEEVPAEVPTEAAIIEAVVNGKVAEGSNIHQIQEDSVQIAPESIPESIPADLQGPLLSSLTKVALPPLPQHVHKSLQEEPAVTDSLAENLQVEDIAAVPSAQDETPSDDDQKNDLSFHSAQESQPDGDEETRKNTTPNADIIEEQLPVKPVNKSAQSQNEHKAARENITVIQDQRGRDVTPASEISPIEAGKKQGAKQTESINPYSKSNRMKQKKEKLTKKKEKLKEKKTGKAEPTSKTGVHSEDKLMKVKDSERENEKESAADPMILPDEVFPQGEKDEELQGKHSQEASFVTATQDFEAQQSAVVQEAGKIILNQSGSASKLVQSLEKADPGVNLTATTLAPSIQFEAPKNDHEQEKESEKKAKIVPTKIAVPSLELLKRKSSPTSATTPPHTAYFSVTSPSIEQVDVINEAPQTQHDVEAPSGIPVPHDSVSIASSSTLRGRSPPPMSTSPTAKEFHTPLQTPIAQGTAPVEAAKKKRKKKSKKKSGNVEGAPSGQEESFHDQLSQIANTQTGYYALRGSDLPAQEVLERKEDKGPKSLIRQVHAYVKEKASGYSRVPESTWNKDHRKQVEKMTPTESEQLMSGNRLPVSKGMNYYAMKEMAPNGSQGKAEKAGKEPHFGE